MVASSFTSLSKGLDMLSTRFFISIRSILCLLACLFLLPHGFYAAQKNKKDDKVEKPLPEKFVVKKLTSGMGLYALGSLSPNKQMVAFIAKKPDAPPNLYVMDLAGFSVRPPLTNLKWGVADPAWSPDNASLAFTGFGETGSFAEIYTINVTSGSMRKLTTNNFTDKEPVFAPDGKRLLYTTDESPLEGAAFGILHIASIPLSGGKGEYFTDDEASTIRPGLTLDGKNILLVKVEESSGRHSLWEYDVKGKPLRDLTEDRFARIHKVVLIPQKNIAVLWAQRQPEQQDNLYFLDFKTLEIIEFPEPDLPKHSPAVSPDGNLIAFISPAESGAHLFMFDATSQQITRLTTKGTNTHSPIFISNDQIIFGAEREPAKPPIEKRVSKNTSTLEDAEPDKEIYLLTLSQKVEEEKKKN
jgi:dipeptidyl aminopeptidase/acylaminoacyl peptidase